MVTVRMRADADKLEAFAAEHQETMKAIVAQAKSHGLMAHRFYADGNGGILVLDEWPDAESFQAFFQGSMGEIGPMFEAADSQGEPEVSFWHELETHDRHGWGA